MKLAEPFVSAWGGRPEFQSEVRPVHKLWKTCAPQRGWSGEQFLGSRFGHKTHSKPRQQARLPGVRTKQVPADPLRQQEPLSDYWDWRSRSSLFAMSDLPEAGAGGSGSLRLESWLLERRSQQRRLHTSRSWAPRPMLHRPVRDKFRKGGESLRRHRWSRELARPPSRGTTPPWLRRVRAPDSG